MTRVASNLVVADTGPLIGLAKCDRLELLRRLFAQVIIPGAVAEELCMESSLPGARALAAARKKGWLRVVLVDAVPERLLAAVDPGEAEAIVLAKSKDARLLIDEVKGRRAACSEGVRVFGTGALLVRAKEEGLVASVRRELDALVEGKYRMSQALLAEIVRLAGE